MGSIIFSNQLAQNKLDTVGGIATLLDTLGWPKFLSTSRNKKFLDIRYGGKKQEKKQKKVSHLFYFQWLSPKRNAPTGVCNTGAGVARSPCGHSHEFQKSQESRNFWGRAEGMPFGLISCLSGSEQPKKNSLDLAGGPHFVGGTDFAQPF